MMDNNTVSINKGTVSFWIKAGKMKYDDGETTPIFSTNPEGGSIFVVKDSDNKLKVFFVVIGKGRADLEYSVSKIDPDKKHFVAITWSLESNELNLYFDGILVDAKKNIFVN